MKIAISAQGQDLNSQISPIFGRCQYFVFVNSDDFSYYSESNQSTSSSGGAGIQAAQLMIQKGVDVIISQNIGPNAFSVFQSADIKIYQAVGQTVRDVVTAFIENKAIPFNKESSPGHHGISA